MDPDIRLPGDPLVHQGEDAEGGPMRPTKSQQQSVSNQESRGECMLLLHKQLSRLPSQLSQLK